MSMKSMIVTDPQPNDVLLGRGSGLMFHLGNLRYRSLVNEYRDEYKQATHKTKQHVAEKIMGIIVQEGGRFLKKMNKDDENWVSVGKCTALEKIKQLLREKRKKIGGASAMGTKRKPHSAEDPRPPTKHAQPAYHSPRSILNAQMSQQVSKVDEELINCLLELPSMNKQRECSTYAPLYGHTTSHRSIVSDKIRKKQEEIYQKNLHQPK